MPEKFRKVFVFWQYLAVKINDSIEENKNPTLVKENSNNFFFLSSYCNFNTPALRTLAPPNLHSRIATSDCLKNFLRKCKMKSPVAPKYIPWVIAMIVMVIITYRDRSFTSWWQRPALDTLILTLHVTLVSHQWGIYHIGPQGSFQLAVSHSMTVTWPQWLSGQ